MLIMYGVSRQMTMDDHGLTLSVGDTVEMDDHRYVVANIRSITIGKRNDLIDIYDLETINPGDTDRRWRPVSTDYLAYRLKTDATVISQRSLGQRLVDRVLG